MMYIVSYSPFLVDFFQSLAYILADKGYDVWMGNTRGNTYSKNHTILDTCSSCRDFWNFGWQEAGRFDLAGVIDYILNLTGNDGVYYVGHSQGTTEYLVGQIVKPIKINSQCEKFLLSSFIFLKNISFPL